MHNLQLLCKRDGLKTHAQIAGKLGLKRTAITNWFNDVASPDMRTIGLVAEKFDVPLRELFHDERDKRPGISRLSDDEAIEALVRNRGWEIRKPQPGKH